MKNRLTIRLLMLTVVLLLPALAEAQTTEFIFQGRLNDGGGPANGLYDFEFRLFDAETDGTMLGLLQRLGVEVNGGSYSVRLDFGANFPGRPRYVEIAYKNLPGPFITLSPRELMASAPYALRSLSAATADRMTATCVGCVSDVNINQISGDKIAGTIPVASLPAGSDNYIQNTTAPQPAANFNISGTGTAGTFNTVTQYNIGGNRVLFAYNNNLFVGFNAGAGAANIGSFNSFFGYNSGSANTTGFHNAFFGYDSGAANTTGTDNAFFGGNSGTDNTTGDNNAFFGANAGAHNTTGSDNAFFGRQAGSSNTTGSDNTFFGSDAGVWNTSGQGNAFFGRQAGARNRTGIYNAFFGLSSGADNTSGGANAFFGRSAGAANTSGTFNTFVGAYAGNSNTTGNNNTIIGQNADVTSGNLSFATAIGSGVTVSTSNTVVLGRSSDSVRVPGNLVVLTLGSAGSTSLCRNGSNQIATCSSSLRYKNQVQPFSGGLDIIRRLHPITFNWKDGGTRDVGFAAEEVEKIEPLLTTRNDRGEIEGVKYGQMTTVLVNAVREQQQIIERQQRAIEQQQRTIERQQRTNEQQQQNNQAQQQQLDALKKLVCLSHPQAEVCQSRKESVR